VTRSDTDTGLRRLYYLLSVLHAGGSPKRGDLARKWNVTPRAVSHLIAAAHDRYAVILADTGDGYEIISPGVFDLERVKEVA
jgi:hypothetical protein